MAEERLIDDNTDRDKDKRYRIVMDEDGQEREEYYDDYDDADEDDGYYDDYGDDDYDGDYDDYDDDYDDGEAEEDAAARIGEARLASARELLAKARRLHDSGDDGYALATLDSAAREYCALSDIYPLMMEILTKNYTEVADAADCNDCAERCRRYCTPVQRAAVAEKLAPLVKAERDAQFELNGRLGSENEAERALRRKKLSAVFVKKRRNFLFALVPFLVFFIAGISLSPSMYSDASGVSFVLTVVFLCMAGVLLVASIAFACFMVVARRDLSLNERNSSTELGKTYARGVKRAEQLDMLYFNLTVKD